MVRTLDGAVRPTMAAVFPPMAISIERQMTGEPHLAVWYDLADRQLREDRVLSNSIVLGFPYADVEEMGTSVIVVADDAPEVAHGLAADLADALWAHRHEFLGRLVDVDAALRQCEQLDGPVCLLDMGDNVGGGSAADGTWIAHEIHKRRLPRSFLCLCDRDAVQQAELAGVGQTIHLRVGGKTDDQHGPPLEAVFRVQSLHDGRFEERQVRHGGFATFDQGRTAIVQTDYGMTVMLTSERMVPFSLQQLRSCKLDPSQLKILVAKGVHAPVAAYQEVCRHFIRVNTPGSTCADMTRLAFRRRRRPMFPFEAETDWPRKAVGP
jgi:microcystin degradation protein MlrC